MSHPLIKSFQKFKKKVFIIFNNLVLRMSMTIRLCKKNTLVKY